MEPFLYYLEMALSNLFKNKAYVIPHHESDEEGEIELVKILLMSLQPPIIAQKIIFISETEDYDSYKYTYDGLDYCIKISLDSDCLRISHESEILEKINPLIRAKYFKDGKVKVGDELRYIITSYENAANLEDLGRSHLIENFDSFCYSYSLMQESSPQSVSFKSHLVEYFNKTKLEGLTEDSLQSIKSYTDFNLINQIMEDMKNQLMTSYDEDFSKKSFLCHGSLNSNNIISKNKAFKFINFDQCFSSHCFLDLGELIIELGIPEEMEHELLSIFCANLKIELTKDTLKFYKKCYEMVLVKKGINLISSYLKEVYLYGSRRIDEIIKISDQFSQSYERYMSIPQFKNNEIFILKTITEPILSQKA